MSIKRICVICICIIVSIIIVYSVENMVDKVNIDLQPTKSIPILMYHHLTTEPAECSAETILVEKFRQDMTALKEKGYNTVTFEDLLNFVNVGKPLPNSPIVITFDDGYLSNYTYAYPILQQLNMKATIFVVGSTVGVNNMDRIFPHFSYEQAKEMYDSGLIDIQSHSYNLHDISNRQGVLKLDNETNDEYIQMLKNDFLQAKENIQNDVGNKVFVFSYPYGLHDDLSHNILKNNGICVSVTTNEGVSKISKGMPNSLFFLDRINVPFDLDTNILLEKIEKYSI